MIKKYDEFINESWYDFKFDNLTSFFKNLFKKDTKQITEDLINVLRDYEKDILNNPFKLDRLSINNMLKQLKKIVGQDVIVELNLDSFFRGLYNVSVLRGDKKENIEDYFNSYIELLPLRIKNLYKHKLDFSDDEEFEEMKKLKKDVIVKMGKKEFIQHKKPLQIELLKLQE
jgi:hypothetical protein